MKYKPLKFERTGKTTEGLVQQRVSAIAGDEQVESFLLSIIFVAWDSFVAINRNIRNPQNVSGQLKKRHSATIDK